MRTSSQLSAVVGVVVFAAGTSVLLGRRAPERLQVPSGDLPHFTASGKLQRPLDWQSWVMVGASLGLTYDSTRPAPVAGASPRTFHTIFVQPWAYRHVQETGEFAENTMFILAMSDASQDADPARGGTYEGERMLAEIHLKKKDLSASGWGFYAFGGGDSAAMIPANASCYDCHTRNGDFDQVFTQFYPPLRHLEQTRTP